MNRFELYEEITAYADNELNDPEREEELSELLENDEDLKFEYKVQNDIKSLLKERYSGSSAPAYLYDSVVRELTGYKKVNEKKKSPKLFEKIFARLLKPQYSPAAVAAALLIFLFLFPADKTSVNSLLDQQQAENNVWVQANRNYSGIIKGELKAAFVSSDPAEIKNYFEEAGVEYSTEVPLCTEWDLAGAVVSEENGQKFAHHVYADAQGHILYLYQIHEKYIIENGALELSPELIDYLGAGRLVKKEIGDHTTYLWKNKEKYFALVSNEEPDKVESGLIAQLM